MSALSSAATILSELESVAVSHDIDIVDVEVTGATKAPVVRVRIDWLSEHEQGISLDDIAAETKWISDALDEIDPFAGAYTLEVSSPGMERPLRRERDFERFASEQVVLSTNATEGRKKFTGTLLGMREGKVALSTDDGEHLFDISEIKRCTIKPDYSALTKKSN